MASVNKVTLIGNLGRDPESRNMPNGDAVCNFSVATTRSWKDKSSGEKQEETEWHRISMFGRLAEIAGEYLKKGSACYIEGRLKTRKWTDKDGVEKYTTEIIGEQLVLLGGGDRSGDNSSRNDKQRNDRDQDRGRSAPPARQAPKSSTGFDDMDDDIPF